MRGEVLVETGLRRRMFSRRYRLSAGGLHKRLRRIDRKRAACQSQVFPCPIASIPTDDLGPGLVPSTHHQNSVTHCSDQLKQYISAYRSSRMMPTRALGALPLVYVLFTSLLMFVSLSRSHVYFSPLESASQRLVVTDSVLLAVSFVLLS